MSWCGVDVISSECAYVFESHILVSCDMFGAEMTDHRKDQNTRPLRSGSTRVFAFDLSMKNTSMGNILRLRYRHSVINYLESSKRPLMKRS